MKLALLTETFENHSLTTLKDNDGQAWFLAKDLAGPLSIGRNAIRMQLADLDPADKDVISIDTPGGKQKMTFVSESGVFQIIVQSRKPQAAKIRKWVCDVAVKYAHGTGPAPDYIAHMQAQIDLLTQALQNMAEQVAAAVVSQLVNSTDRKALEAMAEPAARGSKVNLVKQFLKERTEEAPGERLFTRVLVPEICQYLKENGHTVHSNGKNGLPIMVGLLISRATAKSQRGWVRGVNYLLDCRLKPGLRLISNREAV